MVTEEIKTLIFIGLGSSVTSISSISSILLQRGILQTEGRFFRTLVFGFIFANPRIFVF